MADRKRLTDAERAEAGRQLAQIFKLQRCIHNDNLWDVENGGKDDMGVFETMKRCVRDIEYGRVPFRNGLLEGLNGPQKPTD